MDRFEVQSSKLITARLAAPAQKGPGLKKKTFSTSKAFQKILQLNILGFLHRALLEVSGPRFKKLPRQSHKEL